MDDRSDLHEVVTVKEEGTRLMTRRLAREERIFSGASIGADVSASIRLDRGSKKRSRVITITIGIGLKHLSAEPFKTYDATNNRVLQLLIQSARQVFPIEHFEADQGFRPTNILRLPHLHDPTVYVLDCSTKHDDKVKRSVNKIHPFHFRV